jgi:hypothetical protein
MYEQRNFAIFSVTELDQINFTEVLETSAETVRKSVDGTKTFVKWDGETPPPSVQALTTVEGPYTYTEILDILSTPEWSAPMPVEEPVLVRARNEDGTFIADDPATPDVNEAWEEA